MKTALIFGSTGLIGGILLKLLANNLSNIPPINPVEPNINAVFIILNLH
mgnify:CR=1 FL=1